jgi:hypothetical protein
MLGSQNKIGLLLNPSLLWQDKPCGGEMIGELICLDPEWLDDLSASDI